MSKKNSYLPFALGFINILLFILGISLVISILLTVFNVTEISLFNLGTISLKPDMVNTSILVSALSFINSFIILFVLFCVKQFFQNIIHEQIFTSHNVKLANRISLSLFIASFLGDGILTLNGYSFLNITFMVTALVVWTIGKVLEKANEIAEENEFTI